MRVGKNIKQPAGRNANTTTALDIACSLRAKRRAATLVYLNIMSEATDQYDLGQADNDLSNRGLSNV